MSSAARVKANHLNAQKSTGPRTAEGKAAVSQNAVKHGLSAQHDVIRGEDQEEFDQYRDELFWELNPLGTMQCRMVERIVSLAWRLRRAERLQNEAFETLLAKETSSALASRTRPLWGGPPEAGESEGGESAVGQTIVRDFANYRVLDRLSMYERRIESSLYRTMNEFRKLCHEQELEASAPACSRNPRYSAKQSQSGADGGVCSVPVRASPRAQDVASPQRDRMSAADFAEQSQSTPEVSSLKCEVSREKGLVSSLQLQTSHFTPQTPNEMPYGVATNANECAKQSQPTGVDMASPESLKEEETPDSVNPAATALSAIEWSYEIAMRR